MCHIKNDSTETRDSAIRMLARASIIVVCRFVLKSSRPSSGRRNRLEITRMMDRLSLDSNNKNIRSANVANVNNV